MFEECQATGTQFVSPFSSAILPRAASAHGQYCHHVAVKSSATTPRGAASKGVAASNVSATAVNIFRMMKFLFRWFITDMVIFIQLILTILLSKVNTKIIPRAAQKKAPGGAFSSGWRWEAPDGTALCRCRALAAPSTPIIK